MKVLVFLLLAVKVFAQDCILDLSDPDSPFIVTDALEWPKYNSTENQTLAFNKGDTFFVVCPIGTHNFYLGPTGSEATCEEGSNITITKPNEITIDFVDIICQLPTPTNVTTDGEDCATDGTLYQIGFSVDDQFLTMATVCFDAKKLTPIYCQFTNTFNLTNVTQVRNSDSYYELYICNDTTACSWADGGSLFTNVDIDNIYINQADILEELVGSNETLLLKFPLTTTNLWYLNVVNDGQEIQKIPYYDYINIVPVFNTDLVDVFLYFLDVTLGSGTDIGQTATIGTFGVATHNNSGTPTDLYLNTDDDNVPIPKWIWVLFDLSEKVVLYYNSPSSEEGDFEIHEICNDYTYDVPNIFTCPLNNVTNADLTGIINKLL